MARRRQAPGIEGPDADVPNFKMKDPWTEAEPWPQVTDYWRWVNALKFLDAAERRAEKAEDDLEVYKANWDELDARRMHAEQENERLRREAAERENE